MAAAVITLLLAGATAFATGTLTSTAKPTPLPPPVATPAPRIGSKPCGVRAGRPLHYEHVVLIVMENHDRTQVIGSPTTPYQNQLAQQCGTATNYTAVGSPALSLPNYLALTSGTTLGGRYAGRCIPITCYTDADNIFSQLQADHKTWKAYQESMRNPCELFNDGRYAVRHNPVPYYTNIRNNCLANDVPMGNTAAGAFISDLNNNTMPTFAFITPDLCDDAHDCPAATGDKWLQTWVPIILSSPAYQAGSTALFITYDEGDKTNSVPLIVAAPSVRSGTVLKEPFNHFSLLHTMQQLLGLSPYLENARQAETLRPGFNL
jgi:phospholipase C